MNASCAAIASTLTKILLRGVSSVYWGAPIVATSQTTSFFSTPKVVSKMSTLKRKPSGTTAMEIVTGVGEIASALE